MIKLPLSILILAFSSNALSDSEYYCTFAMSYRLVKSYSIEKVEEYSPKDCKKGDVANIGITDLDNQKNEKMYLSYEISELCSNELNITIVDANRAVCTYRGSKRSKREVTSFKNIYTDK